MADGPVESSVDEIHEKLFTISDEKILQILNLLSRADIEARRIATAPLRPRLIQMRPPRPVTALRLLCEPFEDLLDHAERYERGAKRISRETISIGWRFLLDSPMKSKIQILDQLLKSGLDGEELSRQRPVFWQHCADSLEATINSNPPVLKSMTSMARRDLYRQLGDIVQLLRNGDLILRLTGELPPKPIGDLLDEDTDLIVEVLQEAVRRGSAVIELTLRVLMARMARPGELLDLLSNPEVGIPPAEQAILAREMGTQASTHCAQQADKASTLTNVDPLTVISEIGEVAERLESLHVDGLKDVTAIQEQLNLARNSLRQAVIREIVEGAEPEIAGALASPDSEESDFQRDDRLQKAEDHLIALRRAARYGDILRISGLLADTLENVSAKIEAQADSAIDDIIETPKDERDLSAAVDALYTSVRMLELAAGAQRADELRRRGVSTLEHMGGFAGPSETEDLEFPDYEDEE